MIILLSFFIFLFGLVWLLIVMWYGRKNNNPPIPVSKEPTVCFLIPARNESNVIRELLESIKNQTVPIQDIVVIVETLSDPTVLIVKEYGGTIFVRPVTGRKRKGCALDEAIKDRLKNGVRADLYFIIDADNVLSPTFLEGMISNYHKGYQIATAYRNIKNGNTSVVAGCSSLTFTMLNTIGNAGKKNHMQNNTLSGTGFYIRGDLIDEWQGYPFHSLTEDYELSLYATLHGITTYYDPDVMFYDEQPVSLKTSMVQRTRWIKGFCESRKKYIPFLKNCHNSKNKGSIYHEICGVWPIILMVVGVVLALLGSLIMMLVQIKEGMIGWTLFFLVLGGEVLFVYFILFLFTLFLLWLERKKSNITFLVQIKCLFYHPFFLMTYIPCALKAVFKKEIGWDVIPHGKQK